jgi:hypothetical protein
VIDSLKQRMMEYITWKGGNSTNSRFGIPYSSFPNQTLTTGG